ncbi:MAG: hypothetical protein QG602_856 [Verrucomicrobiota bacterium]|nr:hypothetical protein [Verrucomicrobiota bacterium]
MQLTARLFCLLLLLVTGLSGAADKKEQKEPSLTLEDIIFEPSYLTKLLGPNTLVVPSGDGAGLGPELMAALNKAGVTEKSRSFLLPEGAKPPEVKTSLPYGFPKSLRQGKQEGHARFLVFVGADGAVKTLHCYEFTHRLFALAVAKSVVKWKYTPASINGTAVPVLLELPAEFRGDGYDNKFNYGPERNPIEQPVRDPNRPPPGG